MKRKSLTSEVRLAVLTLARETGNVAFACFSAGISRSLFYKIKRSFDLHGVEGLQAKPRKKPKMPNAFSEEIIAKVLEETKNFPTFSYKRLAERLRAEGLAISGSGVYKIWKRHHLTTRSVRLAQSCIST